MPAQMNAIDNFVARIPFSEVTIRTSLNSYEVIERIERGVAPAFNKKNGGEFYTFEGGYDGNYFVIQTHRRKETGEDAYPDDFYVTLLFFRFKVKAEASPIFYGRVFDDEQTGSTIKGHFGLPFPTFCLLIALIMMGFIIRFPQYRDGLAIIPMVSVLISLWTLNEFIDERKGILDFLKGLFYDVTVKF